MASEEKTARLFTLEEARETVSFLEPSVNDLMDCHRKIKEKRRKLRMDRKKEDAGSTETVTVSVDSESVERLSREMEDLIDEIYSAGAELYGIQRGILHFPARYRNRIVYLCWKYEDDSLSTWHERHEDCPGDRVPIENEEFATGP